MYVNICCVSSYKTLNTCHIVRLLFLKLLEMIERLELIGVTAYGLLPGLCDRLWTAT
jgi:hypothetical protein